MMMSASNDFVDVYNDDKDVFESDEEALRDEEDDEFIEHSDTLTREPRQPGRSVSAKKPRYCYGSLNVLLRAAETVASVLGLVFMTRINYFGYNFTYLEMLWRFRLFIFVSVVSFLSSFSLLVFHSSRLSQRMPINWLTLEVCQSVFLSFGYFVVSVLLSASQKYYSQHHIHWASNEMTATLILGYLCSLLYCLNCCLHCCRCPQSGQVTRVKSALYPQSRRLPGDDLSKFEEVTSEAAIA